MLGIEENRKWDGITVWVERYGGWLSVGLAALVRVLVLAALPYVIARDGIRYLERAEHVAAGAWREAFVGADFNLFPVLVAWVHTVASLFGRVTFEEAALGLNVVSGVALVGLVYRITRRHVGAVAATVVGVYAAVLPELVGVSCAVVREAPYLLLLAGGCGVMLEAVRGSEVTRWQGVRMACAGVLFALAALLRLEALGVMACGAVAVLVAHGGTRWRLARRMTAVAVVFATVVIVLAACFVGIRVRSGQWQFARLDKVHKGYSLGRRDVTLEDVLYTTKMAAYRDDGSVDVATLVRVNFFKMARRNREVLCLAEIVTGLAQAFQLGGVLLMGGVLWRTKRRLWEWLNEPAHTLVLGVTVLLGAVYFRYVSNNFLFSPRYALTLVMVWLFVMGHGWQALWGQGRWLKLGVSVALVIACAWQVVETFQPKQRRLMPVRASGEILRGVLPREARLVAAPGLLEVAYYAQRPYVVLPGQRSGSLRDFLQLTNGYLLVNHVDVWQALHLSELTNGLEWVEVSLPSNKYYRFSVYRACSEGAE